VDFSLHLLPQQVYAGHWRNSGEGKVPACLRSREDIRDEGGMDTPGIWAKRMSESGSKGVYVIFRRETQANLSTLSIEK
jgi:hypothetical protein